MKKEYKIKLKEGNKRTQIIPKVVNGNLLEESEVRVKDLKKNGKEIPAKITIKRQSKYLIEVTSNQLPIIQVNDYSDFYKSLHKIRLELEKHSWLMLCNCGRIDAHVTRQARDKIGDFWLGVIDLGENPFEMEPRVEIKEALVKCFDHYSGWQIRGDWARQKHCQHSPKELFDIEQFYF